MSNNKINKQKLKSRAYKVSGMRCASCELIVEKSLLKKKGVQAVDASTKDSTVLIKYNGKEPNIEELNEEFKKESYVFSKGNNGSDSSGEVVISDRKSLYWAIGLSMIFVFVFYFLGKTGLTSWINVNSETATPTFILFGLTAGLSSCAALVGGIVLSMAKQWMGRYANDSKLTTKLQPHLMFNFGRILSYTLFGALLGGIGGFFQLSINASALLIVVVSLLMIALALQMLGVKYFRNFQIRLPKFIIRRISNEENFSGKYMPMLLGASTFLLPCGFTITAQGFAITSGSWFQGGLIMFFFALGTLPILLGIGISSANLIRKPSLSNIFLKTAGFIVLFFALYNINSQLNVLGVASLDDFGSEKVLSNDEYGLPEIVDGKQIVKTVATSTGYTPKNIKVRAGIPVRWEIEDHGTSGCTNAIISKSLFDGEISLTPGETSIKEYTAEEPGKYKYSCWMGMVTGTIEVVNDDGESGDYSEAITTPSTGSFCNGTCGGSCGGSSGGGC